MNLSCKFCCDNTLVPFEVLSWLPHSLTHNNSTHKNDSMTSMSHQLSSGDNTKIFQMSDLEINSEMYFCLHGAKFFWWAYGLALLGGNSISFYSQTTFHLLGSKSSGEKSGNISVSELGGREGPVCVCVYLCLHGVRLMD